MFFLYMCATCSELSYNKSTIIATKYLFVSFKSCLFLFLSIVDKTIKPYLSFPPLLTPFISFLPFLIISLLIYFISPSFFLSLYQSISFSVFLSPFINFLYLFSPSPYDFVKLSLISASFFLSIILSLPLSLSS